MAVFQHAGTGTQLWCDVGDTGHVIEMVYFSKMSKFIAFCRKCINVKTGLHYAIKVISKR